MTRARSCEVLVLGGGLAAAMAAITARQHGADVVMVVKGKIGDSGSSSKAAGVFAAAFNHSADLDATLEDNVDLHVADTLAIGCELSSQPHARALAEDALEGVLELERLGVAFSKNDSGLFHQVKLVGNSRHRGCSVVGSGHALMQTLRQRLIELGVTILEDTVATSLMKRGNDVTGARVRALSDNDETAIFAKGT
ncbi:MAG: FAD-dependent oxidoreductase, partial [Vulcanimicrobiaceae bacterium]